MFVFDKNKDTPFCIGSILGHIIIHKVKQQTCISNAMSFHFVDNQNNVRPVPSDSGVVLSSSGDSDVNMDLQPGGTVHGVLTFLCDVRMITILQRRSACAHGADLLTHGCPCIISNIRGKTTGQHCLEVNFA